MRPHAVLGVQPGASLKEIKQAYREQCKVHHPDVCSPERRVEAEKVFKEISEAYARLTGRTPIADWQTTSGPGRQYAWAKKGPVRFGNSTVAALLAIPLLFGGIFMGQSYGRLAEASWRSHGLFQPPVNPFLRDDLRATQTRHWGKSSNHPPD